MPVGAVFKKVGHSRCVKWNADICSCWDNSDLTTDARSSQVVFTPEV